MSPDTRIKIEDEHGEYNLSGGSPEPPEDDEYSYDVCGATLKYWRSRYGEKRYCKGMAKSNFYSEDDDDYSEYCKHHVQREDIRQQHKDSMTHGVYSQSYKSFAAKLSIEKYLLAVELFKDLREMSVYDFESETVVHERDASDCEWMDEAAITIEFPVATQNRPQEKSLWRAACSMLMMESIDKQRFADAAADDDLAVGERKKVVSVTEDGRKIKDKAEHHLNIPMSRATDTFADNMQFGGVPMESPEDADNAVGGDSWHFNIHSDDEEGVNVSVDRSDVDEDEAGETAAEMAGATDDELEIPDGDE